MESKGEEPSKSTPHFGLPNQAQEKYARISAGTSSQSALAGTLQVQV